MANRDYTPVQQRFHSGGIGATKFVDEGTSHTRSLHVLNTQWKHKNSTRTHKLKDNIHVCVG